MTFEPLSDRFVHDLEHSLNLPIPASAFPATSAPSASSPVSSPAGLFLSDVPGKPLNRLWPGRIPFGHLTLLDATPGCDLSLLALTLAACVSSGSPLPDGTPTLPGNVILFAPYDSASDTLKPRLEAAGGDPAHVLLFRPPSEDASRTTTRPRSFALPHDLDHLANTIRHLDARLVILDPASAIPGLTRCLPALIELAHQTNCAILLTRMKMAGELVSSARGLYTTSTHPSLAHLTGDPVPVPNVPNPAATTGEVAQQQLDASQ